MTDDVGKPPPLHTCPVCGVSVGSGPVVSTSPMTGLSETRPPIEWRCKHETGGQAMSEPYQDIEQLTGPALAEAVAVKVMGWSRYDSAFANINPPAYRRLVTEYTPGKGVDEEVYRVADFRPDLNIAQAWEVVEAVLRRIASTYYDEPFRLCKSDDDGGVWICEFGYMHQCGDDPPTVISSWSAETAPLAICRAALAAIEAQP